MHPDGLGEDGSNLEVQVRNKATGRESCACGQVETLFILLYSKNNNQSFLVTIYCISISEILYWA